MTKTIKLYKVATISAGNSAPQDEKLFKNGIHDFVRTSDVGRIRSGIIFESKDKLNDQGVLKLKKFPKGTILFPKSGASTFLNHRVILGMDAYVSSHLATIKADNNKVLDGYLFYFLQTIDAANLVTDSAYPSLKTQTISEIELSLPSIQEQQRIVAKLDVAFAEIDKVTDLTKERIIKEKDIKISILKSIYSNIKTQKTIGEIATVIAGQSPEGKYYNKNAEGTPFYQGKKEFGDYKLKEPGVWTTKVTKEALKGDVLLSVRAPVGETNMNYDKICIGRGLAAIRANKENNSEFIYYYLNSIKDQIVGNTGAVFNSINKKQIENIIIPTPSLDEQNQITGKIKQVLSHVKKINLLTKQKLHNLNILKLSMLNKELKSNAA